MDDFDFNDFIRFFYIIVIAFFSIWFVVDYFFLEPSRDKRNALKQTTFYYRSYAQNELKDYIIRDFMHDEWEPVLNTRLDNYKYKDMFGMLNNFERGFSTDFMVETFRPFFEHTYLSKKELQYINSYINDAPLEDSVHFIYAPDSKHTIFVSHKPERNYASIILVLDFLNDGVTWNNYFWFEFNTSTGKIHKPLIDLSSEKIYKYFNYIGEHIAASLDFSKKFRHSSKDIDMVIDDLHRYFTAYYTKQQNGTNHLFQSWNMTFYGFNDNDNFAMNMNYILNKMNVKSDIFIAAEDDNNENISGTAIVLYKKELQWHWLDIDGRGTNSAFFKNRIGKLLSESKGLNYTVFDRSFLNKSRFGKLNTNVDPLSNKEAEYSKKIIELLAKPKSEIADIKRYKKLTEDDIDFFSRVFRKNKLYFQSLTGRHCEIAYRIRDTKAIAESAIGIYSPALIGATIRLQNDPELRRISLKGQLEYIRGLKSENIPGYKRSLLSLDIQYPSRLKFLSSLDDTIANRKNVGQVKKQSTLVLYPRSDHNNAYVRNNDDLNHFYKKTSVFYYEVNNERDWIRILHKNLRKGRVDNLFIGGHGSEYTILYGEPSDYGIIDVGDYHKIAAIPLSLRKQVKAVVLSSCKTGGADEKDISFMMHRLFPGAIIFAPEDDTYISDIDIGDNHVISVQFRSGNRRVIKP